MILLSVSLNNSSQSIRSFFDLSCDSSFCSWSCFLEDCESLLLHSLGRLGGTLLDIAKLGVHLFLGLSHLSTNLLRKDVLIESSVFVELSLHFSGFCVEISLDIIEDCGELYLLLSDLICQGKLHDGNYVFNLSLHLVCDGIEFGRSFRIGSDSNLSFFIELTLNLGNIGLILIFSLVDLLINIA